MMKGKKKTGGRFLFPGEGLDYELLDIGNRRKLERFGEVIVNRPEIEADVKPNLSRKKWESAHFYFFEEEGKKGHWKHNQPAKTKWDLNYEVNQQIVRFQLELTNFKHVGIFPEQAANWHYINQQLVRLKKAGISQPKILNLFAYTGAASVIAAHLGADVTNVDSIKQVLSWAKTNGSLNEIETIRWIHEDARKFIEKAIRRGERYHGIILDPPTYGLGTKGEKWKLEKDLWPLLERLMLLLNHKSHFFILNTYSSKVDLFQLKQQLKQVNRFPKAYESAQLGLYSSSKQKLTLGNLIRFYQ